MSVADVPPPAAIVPPLAAWTAEDHEASSVGMFDWLPEELCGRIAFMTILWSVPAYKYVEQLSGLEESVRNIGCLRQSCRYFAAVQRTRKYLYDLTWRLWSVRACQPLLKVRVGVDGPRGRATWQAHLSFQKDQEMYAMIHSLCNGDLDAIKRALVLRKQRQVDHRDKLQRMGVPVVLEQATAIDTNVNDDNQVPGCAQQ